MLNRRNVLKAMSAALLVLMTAPGWAHLKGYDPVAYFTEGRPLRGKAEFEYTWDEARYRFTSAQHMTLFRTEPDHYTPQFAGSCAARMSRGEKADANPENWLIHDGRLFVFISPGGQELFQANPEATANAGYANWQLLKDAPTGTKVAQ